MNIEMFIEMFYPGCSDWTRRQVEIFIDTLQTKLGERDIGEAFQDDDFLYSIFTRKNNYEAISMSNYFKVKGLIQNVATYYGFAVKIPDWNSLVERSQMIGFFKDVTDLLSQIDGVGEACLGQYYNPRRDLIQIKAICILGWHGYSLDEMVKLKRDDLETIYGESRYSDEEKAVLRLLSIIDGYTALQKSDSKRLKRVYFRGDPNYLFRLVKTSRDKELVTGTMLVDILKRFNSKVPEDMTMMINFPKLRRNALYVYLRSLQTRDSSFDMLAVIQGYFDCSLSGAYAYKREYEVWERTMF